MLRESHPPQIQTNQIWIRFYRRSDSAPIPLKHLEGPRATARVPLPESETGFVTCEASFIRRATAQTPTILFALWKH